VSLTLTCLDNSDGSGMTATVAGSAGGSTNTVLAQLVGGSGFTVAGTRTGDGTVFLSLAIGYYWLYVSNLATGVTTLSNVVYAAVTDSTQAVYQRLHDAAAARIAGLIMAGSPNTNLYTQMIEDDRLLVCPAVFITIGGPEKEVSVLTGVDDIYYQFNIAVVDNNFQDYVGPKARLLLWRQQIARSLRNQRFGTIPENIRNEIGYKPAIDSRLLSEKRIVNGLTLTCVCREPRG